MNVNQLHRELGKLIEAGHGRKPVNVNKRTLHHNLEDDGVCFFEIESVEGPRWIPTIDDDGGTKWNKDGSEAGKRIVVLSGTSADGETQHA